MTVQELFITADQALSAVINQITDAQMALPADPKLTWGKAQTLREVINNHLSDELWVPEVLAGKTIEEVGDKFQGDLLGEDFKAAYAETAQKVQAVVADFTELDKTVHLSYGDFSAGEYLKHISCYRGFRVYTLSAVLGFNTTMPADLVLGLTELILPEADAWRKMGVFGEPIDVPDSADAQTRLLAATGFLVQ